MGIKFMDKLAVISFLKSVGITDFINKDEFLNGDIQLEFCANIYNLANNWHFINELDEYKIYVYDIKKYCASNKKAPHEYDFILFDNVIYTDDADEDKSTKAFKSLVCSILNHLIRGFME